MKSVLYTFTNTTNKQTVVTNTWTDAQYFINIFEDREHEYTLKALCEYEDGRFCLCIVEPKTGIHYVRQGHADGQMFTPDETFG